MVILNYLLKIDSVVVKTMDINFYKNKLAELYSGHIDALDLEP